MLIGMNSMKIYVYYLAVNLLKDNVHNYPAIEYEKPVCKTDTHAYYLYAITKDKKYAKQFEKQRKKNRFIRKIKEFEDSNDGEKYLKSNLDAVLHEEDFRIIYDGNVVFQTYNLYIPVYELDKCEEYQEEVVFDDLCEIMHPENCTQYQLKLLSVLNTSIFKGKLKYFLVSTSYDLAMEMTRNLLYDDDAEIYYLEYTSFDKLKIYIKLFSNLYQ